MGLTCTSLSFRGVRQDEVVAAITASFPEHDCFVSPPVDGWVTVLDQQCEIGPTQLILETSGTICRICTCPSVVLGLLHSDFLYYWLFDRRGKLIDFSYPEDFEAASEEEGSGLAGNLERIADYCKPGVTAKDVHSALSQRFASKDPNFCAIG